MIISGYQDSYDLCLTQVSQMLRIRRNEFIEFLKNSKFIFKINDVWVAYEKFVEDGIFQHHTVNTNLHGRPIPRLQLKITPEGFYFFKKLLNR